jgi:hypothetical protein
MRRPQSASGLAAVFASLLVVSLVATPMIAAKGPGGRERAHSVRRAAACTPWTSEYVPPPTIRVLRSQRDLVAPEVVGTVQEVDFRQYVATTMAVEWPESYPLETLKAGAVATRQFAWYYVINPRGGSVDLPDGTSACYDVVDTTIDQYYYPEKHGPGLPDGPGRKIMSAIADTWDVTLRKFSPGPATSRFFLTGYRAGTTDVCGADANGFKLYHRSTRACGLDGLRYREILRRYLSPNLEIATTGRHDVVGSRQGDPAAMVQGPDGQYVAHVWPSGDSAAGAGSRAGLRLTGEDVVGFASGDVNDDGRDDLVWLLQTEPRSGRVQVALSDGSTYGGQQTWYEGGMLVPLGGAKLLIGDFHADGRVDVAVLGRGETEGEAQLVVLKKKPGDGFLRPARWWSGSQDMATVAAAWAGDLSGDGRADLILRQHPESGGVRIKTAVTGSPLPKGEQRMGTLRSTYEVSLDPAKVKMVPGDVNRDGREDLFLLTAASGRARVERLQGQARGAFKRVALWTAPRSDRVATEKTRLGAADVDNDGMTDLVLFARHPDGTRLRVLRAGYQTLRPSIDLVERLDWLSLRPY